jgi:hypothetical protein
MKMSNFLEAYKSVNPKIVLFFKRVYVVTFNVYAWFWLFRQIFFRHSTNYEEYLLWGLMVFGMYMFGLDHQEIYFKKNKKI